MSNETKTKKIAADNKKAVSKSTKSKSVSKPATKKSNAVDSVSKSKKNTENMTAVFVVGGSQVIASSGEEVTVDNISAQKGEAITFDKVLLTKNEDKVNIGKPYIKNAKVIAEVVAVKKGKKVEALKYKAKARYRRRWGYRQNLTRFVVKEIVA